MFTQRPFPLSIREIRMRLWLKGVGDYAPYASGKQRQNGRLLSSGHLGTALFILTIYLPTMTKVNYQVQPGDCLQSPPVTLTAEHPLGTVTVPLSAQAAEFSVRAISSS